MPASFSNLKASFAIAGVASFNCLGGFSAFVLVRDSLPRLLRGLMAVGLSWMLEVGCSLELGGWSLELYTLAQTVFKYAGSSRLIGKSGGCGT